MPEKLDRQLAYHAENPGIRWSYTGRTMIDADGERLPSARFKAWVPHAGWILRQVLVLDANIALPSVMAERVLLREAGDFNEAWLAAQDYELWLRLAERCVCGVIDEPLAEIRKHRTETYQHPDVSLGLSAMLEQFSGRTSDPALRTLARTKAAYHAVDAADRLSLMRQWGNAFGALAIAWRISPAAPFAYRAAARLARRRLRATLGR
jgi:hypothetical protein